MRIKKDLWYAIITGDIVGSTRLSKDRREQLPQQLTRSGSALRRAYKKVVPVGVEVHRGDSWQLLVTDPVQSLRVALYYRAHLLSSMESYKLDTRMAIGVGPIDFIPGERISEGDGEAFRLSGRGLDAFGCGGGLSVAFSEKVEDDGTSGLIMLLLNQLISRWSEKQSLAVTGALRGWSQEKVARTCWVDPITQQAVAQHLDRASWPSIEATLDWFERMVEDMLE